MSLRLGAFFGLAAYGLFRWGAMLAPRQTDRAWAGLALAAGVVAVCFAVRRLHGRARRAGSAAALLVALLAAVPGALLVAGVPLRFLRPHGWDELTSGLGRGFSAMPDILLPFLGPGHSWPARTILAGGALLAALAAWLAFRPGRGDDAGPPWAAAVVLGVLAGVPAVVLPGDGAIPRGLVLLLGLAAFLAGPARPSARLAPGTLALAAVGAVLLFPVLDSSRPWVAYEAVARTFAAAPESFSFDHGYGPITWPRTGRELLRVRAPRPGYWKAADLEYFDGIRWRTAPGLDVGKGAAGSLASVVSAHPEWKRRVEVTIRGLTAYELIAPGEALDASERLGGHTPAPTPGRFIWQTAPREGDSYDVTSYAPDPSGRQLAAAGTDYPGPLRQELVVPLPGAAAARPGPLGAAVRRASGHGAGTVLYPGVFGHPEDSLVTRTDGGAVTVRGALAGSAYAGVARLARRLLAGAPTPYAYAKRIEAYLSRGFSYTESPPASRVPLADFLLRTKRGYCQHFSGAMALLLRLGGVPARVAAGFAPGRHDERTGEWVVSDLDAHSWVEAWFPGVGWVTFDPTPAASPARGQATTNRSPLAGLLSGKAGSQLNKDLAQTQKTPRSGAARAPAPGRAGGGGAPAGLLVLGGGALLGLALAIRAWRPARRGALAELDGAAELERALRRAGRPPAGGTTLRQLEARLAGAGDAAAYVRSVRARRYNGAAAGPTPAERRGLRRELARGLGPLGLLRAWWALPPRTGS